MQSQYTTDPVDFARHWGQAITASYEAVISGGRYLVMVNSVMLIIGTIQVVLSFVRAGFALQIVRLEVEGSALTDGLFTYRCYVVWGRSIYATILPIAMLTATTVAGYVLEVQIDYRFSEPRHNATIGFILSVATNFVLMTLTAGRIWWVGREVRTVLESSTRHYDTAVAMIVIYYSNIVHDIACIPYNRSSQVPRVV
ncbi:hypothetical protein C8R44DRAFT_730603 [Mycena epipterygia]|nr:hypothetical protein C8R44DRAFT_730603 [Mycena epipterygia]